MNRTDLLRNLRKAAQLVPAVVDYLSPEAQAAIKAASDLGGINSQYHDAITQALITYFEGGSITGPRNSFKRATVVAFADAFILGYEDGGGEMPLDEELNAWLDTRTNEEFGHIDTLFEQAKALRKEEGVDTFAWATARADGYTRTLSSLYNQGKLFGAKNKMLTFDGEDGTPPEYPCPECRRLKGKRHKASWWIANGLIPGPGNSSFTCGGWNCRHYLRDDEGNKFTV